MSYTAQFNKSAFSAGTFDAGAGLVSVEDRQKAELDKANTLSLTDRALESGLRTTNSAPDDLRDTDNDRKKKAKENEAFQRQLMLQRLLDDMRDTLGKINAAIDATDKIIDLIKKKQLDVNNPEHLELLLIARIDPKLAENGELTVEFAEKHDGDLRIQQNDYQKFIDQGENINTKDPEFYNKIQDLENSYMGKRKIEEFVTAVSDDDKKAVMNSLGVSKEEQELFIEDDDFGNDFDSRPVSISAATEIQGEAIKNAPDLQRDFISATQPQTELEVNITPTPITPVTKVGLG